MSNNSLLSFFGRIDLLILIPALFLVLISLSTLLSISPAYFRQQIVALVLGLVGFLIFTRIDLSLLSYLSKFLYGGMLFLLVLVLLFGVTVNAAKSWFDIFGMSIQASEIIKPFFLIVLATFLTQKIGKRIYRFLGALLITFPVFFLIYQQPDLGTGIVYIAASLMVIFLAGFPLRYILLTVVGTSIIIPILFFFLQDYQKQRILTFFDVTSDPTGASYNAIQSLISIGSGGFFGKGFGQGTQSLLRFLPEQQTDFIFATISEDLGFIGSFIVLCLFGILLYRIYKVAISTESAYQYLVCMGVFAIFFFQILFNVGMNLGLMPIIGITLPFVSLGGSSLLASFIALGMISGISKDNKKHQSMEIA